MNQPTTRPSPRISKTPIRRRTKALAAGALAGVLAVSVGIATAGDRTDVAFTEITDDYVVLVDGVIVDVVDTETEAADAAAQRKVDDPEATVLYQERSVLRADLAIAPEPVPEPTTSPTSEPTAGPTAEPEPTTSPTSEPTAGPTAEPTAAAQPTTPPTTGGLVWGIDDTAPSTDWARPELGQTVTDPAYGTTLRRLTSAEGTRFDRNTYSRRQAENADGTSFFTYHGDAEYRVYDRVTGDLVRITDIHPDGEPQWHPSDPDVIRHIAGPNSYVGDLKLYETDVTTGATSEVADLTARVQAAMPGALYLKDRAEGSPSADGDRYAWLVYDDNEDIIGIVSYDLGSDAVLGTITDIRSDVGDLDWVSMSPTGEHVVAGYWYGTFVYAADLSNERQLNGKGDHSDIALDASGGDAYVYIDFSADVDGGWLVSIDLDTLERTRLFDLYEQANTSIHISGKGYERPGWIVVSTYNCKVPGAWSCEKVMAVELATGQILNLAHTYNCGDNYWTETHAVVNRDFSRVYFNTDSGSCGIDAEVMQLDIPEIVGSS